MLRSWATGKVEKTARDCVLLGRELDGGGRAEKDVSVSTGTEASGH